MKAIVAVISVFILIVFSGSALAWNATGHRIIAQIAYDQLTPNARKQVLQLTKVMAKSDGSSKVFANSAAWADDLRIDGVNAFNHWHFIDTPYFADNTVLPKNPMPSDNIVWAIQQCLTVLQNPNTNRFEKAFFLRMLIHLVGDAHQPLHCINRYSRIFPNGDNGGNLFLLPPPDPSNLHAYWDDGLGLFDAYNASGSLTLGKLKSIAKNLEIAYPAVKFATRSRDLNPQVWVNESFYLAKTFVYQTPVNKPLTQVYLQQGQIMVQQQLVIAGYRLGQLLNQLFATTDITTH